MRKNLLCLTYADSRGRVFLVDLEERRPVAFWDYQGPGGGYADAAGVAMAEDFTIYVADPRNDRLRCYSPFGKLLGDLGDEAQRPPGSVGRDRDGFLDRPHAVACFQGRIYVGCGEQPRRRGLQCLQRSGQRLDRLQAFGDAERDFGAPRGVWAGLAGIFVADTLHGAVQRFTVAGRYVDTIRTSMDAEERSRPVAVVPLASGDLLVADEGDRPGLRRFSIEGRPQQLPAGVHDLVQHPVGLAVDERQRVYVLDRDGEHVQRLLPDLTPDGEILDLMEYLHGE